MLRVGLTGNIGSGKTVVSMVFSLLGIPVSNADKESKKLLDEHDIKNEIVKHFGYGILTNGREINRRSLATAVFTDPQALTLLNSILHPRVMRDFHAWADSQASKPYVIQESAIIFENGLRSEYDYVIHVSCPGETAIDRVIKRDGIDGHSVRRRMRFQMDDGEKSRLSDFVIRNDGTELVLPQVLSIHRQLLKFGTDRNDEVSSRAADA